MVQASLQFHPVTLPPKIPEGKLPFDIFIHYQGQYLCFRPANTPVTEELWEKLKGQRVSQLYVEEKALKSYQMYMRSLFDLALSFKGDLSNADRMGFVTMAAVSSVRSMAANPNDKGAFTQSRQVSGGLINLLRSDPLLLETLVKMDLKEDILFVHSKNVAALSIGLAFKAKVKPETLEFLALAGLLHDIGVAHMPKEQRELFYRPPKEVDSEQYNRYLRHGKNMETIFETKSFIPKMVAELIANHEYDRSTNAKMNPLAQMLSMADKFDKMATIYGYGPLEAFKIAKKDFLGRYDLPLINLLGLVLREGRLI